MDGSKRILAGLLIISVCLNLYGLAKINNLMAVISDTRSEVYRLEDRISSQATGLRSVIEEIRQEERWMSPLSVIPGNPQGDTQPVTLTWQLKECPVDASVTLYLRERGESDFTPYPAQSTGGGGFKADLVRQIQPESNVSFSYSREDSPSSGHQSAIVESSSSAYLTGRYEYYVTMTDEHVTKTTDATSFSIDQSVADLAAPVSVDIQVKKDPSVCTVVVHETPKPEAYYYRLQGVSIRVMDGDVVAREIALTSERTFEAETPQGMGEVPIFEVTLQEYGWAHSEVLLALDYGEGMVTEVLAKYLMDPGRF